MSDRLVLSTKKENLILLSDAYKYTHWKVYPKGTQRVYSYLESRGTENAGLKATMFFGLQIYLKKYLEGVVVEQWMIDEAEKYCNKVFGQKYFNKEGWQRIVDLHGGKLPVKIKAVPEGTVVPTRNVLMTIENTDDQLPWITNFLETLLFEACWYGTTVASMSFWIKQLIDKYAKRTGESVNDFHLNDFGFRGVSSLESAGIGGSAHLINFLGTDNFAGITYAMKYYDADVCGYSVLASEHSVVETFTKNNEIEAYKSLLNEAPDDGIISSVSDTYDFKYTVDVMYGKILKDKILSRKAKFVVRPDSGYPPEIAIWTLENLWKNFGGTINSSGFKVLDPHVGVIYGDGIEFDMINRILNEVVSHGFCISNIIFGMGGALLQKLNRDTFKMAIKASSATVNGIEFGVFKETLTDKSKASKQGKLKLIKYDDELTTVPVWAGGIDILQTVFYNGELITQYTFDDIRNLAKSEFKRISDNTHIKQITTAYIMYYAFKDDLKGSKSIEDRFEAILNLIGYITERGNDSDWDIKAKHPITGIIKTFEIKDDIMADITGNVAIEYSCGNSASGLSITKADYWVQYFEDEFHVVDTIKLKNSIERLKHMNVTGGDEGSNTKMHLIKKERFKKISTKIKVK